VGPQPQSLTFNFAQGLELKTDPKQIPAGKFLSLQNAVFNNGGLLQKRNGFGELTLLPNDQSTYLTTFNGNLTAISSSINALSTASDTWVTKGNIQPLQLSTLPLIRSNTNQSQVDIAIAPNGLICTAYTDQNPANLSLPQYKYAIANSITGQNIVQPTIIIPNSGTVSGVPRVFTMGNWFIILYTSLSGGTSSLEYIAVSLANVSNVMPAVQIDQYTPNPRLNFDGVVVGTSLFIAYNSTSGGQAIKIRYINNSLGVSSPTTFAGFKATVLGMCVDETIPTVPTIYASFYDSVSSTGYTLAINNLLQTVMSPVEIITSGAVLNITPAAQNGICTSYYEVQNAYGYDGSIPTNYVESVSVPVSTGIPTAPFIVARSIGLASKAFIINSVEYFLSAYQSGLQPTYFLIDGTNSIQASPIVVGKLAYQNGGGYLSTGLPNALVNGDSVSIPYLFKDLVTAVNKNTNVPSGTQIDGIYSQTGINYATFTLGTEEFDAVEIASALHMSGGFFWMYDGYLPVEQNFFLYPDNVEASWSDSGGNMTGNPAGWVSGQPSYAYQVIYEWTDNQGNAHQSAPSVPVYITLGVDSSTNGSVAINFPSLRLTYKTSNPVKAVIYRWSIAQQVYYQITSIELPLLNTTTSDTLSYLDTLTDPDILGNSLIYTTGGVVEDVNAPASNIITLWQTRLFLVDSEDKNLIWYSKQVIENTPVEMSDLFTIFVAPTIGASGSTGPITAMGAMDDKLIVFKRDAIYYVSGTGPDNTGANNNFSDPIFVTSVAGCTNQQSLVNVPMGMMFQSDKGIWLLDRSLNTTYVGAPVEPYALASAVKSALLIPGTNQVRFTMASGVTLMYDYYYQQWATFNGIPGISSCIYNELHTFLDSFGRVFQETPGVYLDGDIPTIMSFTTGWLNLAGFQSYQRMYEFALVGTYFSPHILDIRVAFDFQAPTQQSIINPQNFTGVYGSDSLYGQTTPYGGPSNLEQWRIHAQHQKCQVFQITVNEVYNPQYGNLAGAGLNISGISCKVGIKKSYRPYRGNQSVG
jgi:hypothetical protein